MATATVSRIDTEMDQAFLECRTYAHAWDRFNPTHLGPPQYGWRLSLRCTRCTSERHDIISLKTNKVTSRRYIYADGYLIKGIPKVVFREALFLKLRAKLEKANQIGEVSPEPTKKRATRKKAAV